MKKEGKVVRWDSARGFGFISSPDTPVDVFFHTRDFQGMAAPHEGMPVTFEEIHVGGKGPRAMSVKTLGSSEARGIDQNSRSATRHPRQAPVASALRRRPTNTPALQAPAGLVMLLMLGWTALVLWVGRFPALILAGVPLLNLLTFYVYWTDKHAAQTGRWRTKESTLHLFGLLGGWPGAWFAHQILRHKSRKAEFRATYWGTVLVHCAALLGWLFWLQPKMLSS